MKNSWQGKVGWLILREISPLLSTQWLVNINQELLAQIANIILLLSIHILQLLYLYPKNRKLWQMFSLLVATWKKKHKDAGSNTHKQTLINGLLRQQKRVELICLPGECMLSVFMKGYTNSERTQCHKLLIKYRTTKKICSCFSFQNNSKRFLNKKKYSLLEDIQKKATSIRMFGSKCH